MVAYNMEMNRKKLFDSLKDIYGKKTFDLDNSEHINALKKKGWIFEVCGQQIKKPDFLILEFDNRTILIELKALEEKEIDKIVKKKIQEMKEKKRDSVFYWVDSYRKNLKGHIQKSSNQYKEFIKNNIEKFYKNRERVCNFSTVVAFYSERFIHDYTLPEIRDELFGITVEDINEFLKTFYYTKDSLLNIKRYRAIGLIAVWDGKVRFNLYNNPFTHLENNIPIFLTKKDINNFIIDIYFSKLKGIRIFIIKQVSFDKKEIIRYYIDNTVVDKENFIEVLHSKIKYVDKTESEDKEEYINLVKRTHEE